MKRTIFAICLFVCFCLAGQSFGDINIAPLGTATGNAASAGYSASNGNDGEGSSLFYTLAENGYWELELDKTYDLTRIRFLGQVGFPERSLGTTVKVFAADKTTQIGSTYTVTTQTPFYVIDNDGAGYAGAKYIRFDKAATLMTLQEVYAMITPPADMLANAKIANVYRPVDGGWHIWVTDDILAMRLEPSEDIGVVDSLIGVWSNARNHARLLFPPADKSTIGNPKFVEKMERQPYRPAIFAYIGPKFAFDMHSAGGNAGHLFAGLKNDKQGKWFHKFSDIDVTYVNGCMKYELRDVDFPGVVVNMEAQALADATGAILKINVTSTEEDLSLVWGYGGASARYSHSGLTETYAPEYCKKNIIELSGNSFTLIRPYDKSDHIFSTNVGDSSYLLGWKVRLTGTSTWPDKIICGYPENFADSPITLLSKIEKPKSRNEQFENRIALQVAPLKSGNDNGFIVIGVRDRVGAAIKNPAKAWESATERNKEIAGRMIVKTPDPYLNAAVTTLAFGTEGIWGDVSYMTGGWSWRNAYLGWRNWYGPVCYGWEERVKKSILNHTTLSLVKQGHDKGALAAMIEYSPTNVYYNMNEVFLDMTRQYFDYTNDIDTMRKIFPILKSIVEWENRRLRSTAEYLYESALNTWVSDTHWYIRGHCTQASSYMLQANNLLATMAEQLGEDPEPYRYAAKRIYGALQKELWMPREGAFAESKDTTGYRMLHKMPELATIYHSSEFGAADPFQIMQMTHWVETHIKKEITANDGVLYWSSDWWPNRGRQFTHTTYDLTSDETLNYILTNYLADKPDEGYQMLKGVMCGVFSGPSPGGLPGRHFRDGRFRSDQEFGDTIGMWGRVIAEGLFGIFPKRYLEVVELKPSFPSDWNEASIETKHFSYEWNRSPGQVDISWKSPVKTSVKLALNVDALSIEDVRINGSSADYSLEPGFNTTTLRVTTPKGQSGTVSVKYSPAKIAKPETYVVTQEDQLSVSLGDLKINGLYDPQGLLSEPSVSESQISGTVLAEAGPGLFFASVQAGQCPQWIPIPVKIESKIPPKPRPTWSAPAVAPNDLSLWHLVDMDSVFNSTIGGSLRRVADLAPAPPLPASQVGFGYWKNHLIERCLTSPHPPYRPTDKAWREKVGADGIAWTTDGIPFKTVKDGNNIAIVTQAGGFETKQYIPIGAAGKKLYLMMSGITFAMQSHVINLRATLTYSDGSKQYRDMINPFDIGDCWSPYGGYHDTASNGFENLGGRRGPAGSAEVEDLTKPIMVDTEAHLVSFDLKPGIELSSVEIEAIANDLIFGVMGATILN